MTRKTLIIFLCSLLLSVRAMGSNPVIGLLERIDKGASKKFFIERIDSVRQDFFEVYNKGERIAVRGNNYISIAAGIRSISHA